MSRAVQHIKKSPKRLSMTKVKARKKQLRLLNGIEKSWRIIQRDYYPEVSYQTLNRFAMDKTYIPAGDDIRQALDLFADQNPYGILPRWYQRTPEALAYFNGKREQIKAMFTEAKRQAQEWKKV